MGVEKITDEVGKTEEKPSGHGPNHLKPWVLTMVFMAIIALGWSIYMAQKRGGGLSSGKAPNRDPLAVLNTEAVPGSVRGLQASYHSLIERIRPAVISIDAATQAQNTNPGDLTVNYDRIGSGVIIDPRGYALSSLRVVEAASSLKATVYGPSGALEYPIKIVKGDRASDLVLLRIQGDRPFPHADLGDSDAVRSGDIVLAIGNPFGFEQSVTSGIISSRNRTLKVGGMIYENMIQTDSSINKGSSGGPLLSAKGEVIAINTAIYSSNGAFAGISFAVPINRSLELMGGVVDFQNQPPPVANGQLAALGRMGRQVGNAYRFPDGRTLVPPHCYRGTCTDCHPQFRSPGFNPSHFGVERGSVIPAAQGQGPNQVWGGPRNTGPCYPVAGPWCTIVGPNNLPLGLTVSDVDEVIAGQNSMLHPGGVFVIIVTSGTPAAAAGLQRGDVIVRIDGRKIKDVNSFDQILRAKRGSRIDLVILRMGARITVRVRMRPGSAQAVAGTAIQQPTEFTWLGGEIIPLPPGSGKAGVYVAESLGLLGKAGVQQGDVITGLNHNRVTDIYSFINLTKTVDTRKGLILDVIRSGYPLFITVKDR
ncbi:MAG: trypsin-like peptidase domain-containing protein [Deltaproteobacteria bacterium]|nr:trypsin-like peptidase domain-containing protein [Deltaproteobacteria bacterium]